MPVGPGKYDDLCTYVRERTGGSVVLIVVDGSKGPGFSVQANLATTMLLPDLLEHLAAQIRRDMKMPRQ
jgi:hypothetical protein